MAGIRWPPEEPDHAHTRQGDVDAASHYSDDERSLAADSWSVKSEYGSTLDGDDTRQSDAVDALAAANFRPLDYSSDKEEPDVEVEHSMLGLQSHWDSAYAEELANFHEHGDAGEVWFGEGVMETMASWTARVCLAVSAGLPAGSGNGLALADRGLSEGNVTEELASWSVLDLGTGNGVLLHALSKHGFTDLTGSDYSDGAIELAQAVAEREGLANITFVVDDVLETKLERKFKLITDKGTLDAVGLHPDGAAHKILYWRSITKLLEPGGVLVVTSCNNTKNELVEEVNAFIQSLRANGTSTREEKDSYTSSNNWQSPTVEEGPVLEYIDHVRTYPTFRFGGSEGSQVCTVAFILRA
ncbi:EEF1A lysine methyltransferase 2 [Marchantia polymorpha subsp. ruderalis]|uniref:Protein-lysine N-methyltransferase Mp_3g09080 n=2 Tax=Marchantia polymorpha TaxID=3197 RepID=A0AAF6AYW9_MARPO|nr:hypothetical protein MARPO_0105s0009 [Marchantia polymorpha]BBN04953.1 hypothetical protein Mp_3g09080 [Marchantia polymorpha subsp. ruderalis]|eukprot:PTQ31890.1 hypothetical protein MARPO_0105s0009 [Marchantia polymorpha]